MTYYGVIQEIWEVDYTMFTIPLLKCKWVDNKRYGMFSFHKYMVEHHSSSKDEAPTKRPIRGATRLGQLLIRRANCQKTPIDIDVDIRIPRGHYVDVFKSYLGMLAGERISIPTPSFDHVIEVDRDMIW